MSLTVVNSHVAIGDVVSLNEGAPIIPPFSRHGEQAKVVDLRLDDESVLIMLDRDPGHWWSPVWFERVEAEQTRVEIPEGDLGNPIQVRSEAERFQVEREGTVTWLDGTVEGAAPQVVVYDLPPVLRGYDAGLGDQRKFDRDEAIAVALRRVKDRGCRQQVRKVQVVEENQHLVPSWLIQDI